MLLSIGVVLGFVPTVVNSAVQGLLQRENIIIGHRMTVIKEMASLSESLSGVLADIKLQGARIDRALHGKPSPSELLAIQDENFALYRNFLRTMAAVDVQLSYASAAYGVKLPAVHWKREGENLVRFDPVNTPSDLQAQLKQLATAQDHLTTIMEEIASICRKLGQRLEP
jgi:hypothetical protein